MTPREKASYLIVNYQLKCKSLDYSQAVDCSLLAVDEILSISNLADEELNYKDYLNSNCQFKSYWNEVKQEIINLKTK